jgi:hypothetical protein
VDYPQFRPACPLPGIVCIRPGLVGLMNVGPCVASSSMFPRVFTVVVVQEQNCISELRTLLDLAEGHWLPPAAVTLKAVLSAMRDTKPLRARLKSKHNYRYH